jgi:hypothetical protein
VNDRAGLLLGLSLWALAVLVFATHVDGRGRTVAVTFDDLPATASAGTDVRRLTQLTEKLLASVLRYRTPAVGFVNEGKLLGGTEADVEARTRLPSCGWMPVWSWAITPTRTAISTGSRSRSARRT